MRIYEIPRRPRRQVRQEQLETLIALSNALRLAEKEVTMLEKELLDDLLCGAEVEPGVHIAEVESICSGGKRVQKLKVR